MSAAPEARARSRAFARVIGPFLVIVPAIVAVRAPNAGTIASAFFQNEALVWITGGLLLFGGLLIIAQHQYWSGLSAILISLFGWFLALRGIALLAVPQLYASATAAAMNMMPVVQITVATSSIASLGRFRLKPVDQIDRAPVLLDALEVLLRRYCDAG